MYYKIENFLSSIAENLKAEGEALEKYESLACSLRNIITEAQYKIERHNDTSEFGVMTDEEKAECEKCIADATELLATINEIIADEINHSIILAGKLVKFSGVRPSQDNLAGAIAEITVQGDV